MPAVFEMDTIHFAIHNRKQSKQGKKTSIIQNNTLFICTETSNLALLRSNSHPGLALYTILPHTIFRISNHTVQLLPSIAVHAFGMRWYTASITLMIQRHFLD